MYESARQQGWLTVTIKIHVECVRTKPAAEISVANSIDAIKAVWISNGRSGECEARNGQGLILATVRSPLDGSAAERHIRQAVDKPQNNTIVNSTKMEKASNDG